MNVAGKEKKTLLQTLGIGGRSDAADVRREFVEPIMCLKPV